MSHSFDLTPTLVGAQQHGNENQVVYLLEHDADVPGPKEASQENLQFCRSSDYRGAKRSQLAAGTNQMEVNNGLTSTSVHDSSEEMVCGFSTARGATIKVIDKTMKRAADTFVDIDNKYKHVDPMVDEPLAKRKLGGTATFKESCSITPKRSKGTNFDAVQCVDPKSKIVTINARNIFGDDSNEMDCDGPNVGLNRIAIAGPSKLPEMGFSTARGANIAIKQVNMQRYTKVLNEIERDVNEEVDAEFKFNGNNSKRNSGDIFGEDLSDLCGQDEPNVGFKVPETGFITSTPKSSKKSLFESDDFDQFDFDNMTPIVPIVKKTIHPVDDCITWSDKEWDEMFSQQQLSSVCHRNRPINVNVLQQTIEDSPIGKVNVMHISEAVKCARQKALSEYQPKCQEKRLQHKNNNEYLFQQKSLCLHQLGIPKFYERGELYDLGVQSNVIDVNIDNALQFKFDMWNFYPLYLCQTNVNGIDMSDGMKLIMDGNGRVGVREMSYAFLHCPSVDPKLVPDHWIANSLKWIILKLASYERSFPDKFGGRTLTPENVRVFPI